MKYMLDTNICIYAIKHKPEFTVLDFHMYAAEEYGKIRAELERKGTPIGLMDLLIAGHASSEWIPLL